MAIDQDIAALVNQTNSFLTEINSRKVPLDNASADATAAAATAATKASEATASATAAANSATAALGAIDTAAAKVSEAATSATNAAAYASAASGSATTASGSAQDATRDAGIVDGKATEAAGYATAAATDAGLAQDAVTTATAQAGTADAKATEATNSATAAAASVMPIPGAIVQAKAIYDSTVALRDGVDQAARQASLAAGLAAGATSIVQQDLTAVTAASLHRSPNDVKAMFIYDTSKDSDGGAWTDKCQHTSWWNEPLNGKWLGAHTSEINARGAGGTLGQELVLNSEFTDGSTNWSAVYGAAFSVSSGVATVNGNNSAYGSIVSAGIATTIGKHYVIRARAKKISGNAISIAFGYGAGFSSGQSGSVDIASANDFYDIILTAVATAATMYVGVFFGNSPSTGIALVESISVKEVVGYAASGDYYQAISADTNVGGRFYRLWKNLLSNSNDLATGWTKSGGTTVEYGYPAPDGTNTAWKVTFPNGSATSQLYQNVNSLPFPLTQSVQLKADAALSVGFGYYDGTSDSGNISLTTSWQTFTRTRAAGLTAGDKRAMWFYSGGANQSFYLWHPQLETGTVATAYESKSSDATTTEVFRGNKSKFPRLAALVAEASNLTIYDLTEPGRPMWMRFIKGGAVHSSPILGRSGSNTCGVTASNGLVVTCTNNNYAESLPIISFPADSTKNYTDASLPTYRYVWGGTIAERNANKPWLLSYSIPSIASATVNALAMTVLPDAPTDPATGLKVPTVWVATAGGLSVVKHDGTVVSDGVYTQSSALSVISPNTIIAQAAEYNWQTVYYTLSGGTLLRYGASGLYASNFLPPIQYSATPSAKIASSKNAQVLSIPDGFSQTYWKAALAKINNASPTRSTAAYISSTFNTGHMVGDIRRAYLADVGAGSVGGVPNLLTNGDFSSGSTTNWNLNSTWSISAGAATSDGVGAGPLQYISPPIVNGKTYALEFDVLSGYLSQVYLGAVGTGGATAGHHRRIATCVNSGSGSALSFNLNAGSVTSIDNVVVYELISDRSYKAQGAAATGTLTKSAVATNAQLVGYSGFSAANYLREPYSTDLDFGTGEWSVGGWVNVPASTPLSNTSLGPELWVNPTYATSVTPGTGTAFTVTNPALGDVASVSGMNQNYIYYCTITVSSVTGWWFFGPYAAASGSRLTITAPGTYTAQVGSSYNSSVASLRPNDATSTSISVSSVSIRQVLPTPIMERRYSSGAYISLGVNPGVDATKNGPKFSPIITVSDGTTVRTLTAGSDASTNQGLPVNTGTWLKAEATYKTGRLAILVNGQEVASSVGAPLEAITSRYNLFAASQQMVSQLGNYWAAAFGSVTAGDVAAPDGTMSAARLTATNASGRIGQISNSLLTVVANKTYTLSIYLRRVSGTGDVRLFIGNAGSPGFVVVPITSDWARYSMTFTATSSGNADIRVVDLATSGDVVDVWGAQFEQNSTATAYQRTTTVAETNVAPLTIGNSYALDAPFPGSIALLKLGATVPTAEQALWAYQQEAQMFRDNAQVTLPDSGNIVDLAYDDATDRWIATSATNESTWAGLVRTSVTPVPAGSYIKTAATSGIRLQARSTTNPGVDVTIPSYELRTEMVKKAETFATRAKDLTTFDYLGGFKATTSTTGAAAYTLTSISENLWPAGVNLVGAKISGSGIPTDTTIVGWTGSVFYLDKAATAAASNVQVSFLDFPLPAGYEAKVVMAAGALKQEGTGKSYTRLFDGFFETIRFGTAPAYNAEVQIQAVRRN